MIPIAALAGIIVGLIAGGRFRSIFYKRFRLWPMIAVAFICGFLLSLSFFSDYLVSSGQEVFWRTVLAAVQLSAATVFLYANRRKPGVWFILAGGVMNGMVIMLNAGRMPVGRLVLRYGEQAADKINEAPHYFLMQGGEPLWFLADIMPAFRYMLSAGDLLIMLGVFLLGVYMSRPIRRKAMNRRSARQTAGRF